MTASLKISGASRALGPNLLLRLITLNDAAYVYGLRTNPQYNRYLSEVVGDVGDQRRWIESYKCREARAREFYYIIERRDGVRCGVVRLYDIEQGSFTWGSWILDDNKPKKAALESAVLSFCVAFEALALKLARVDVAIQNTHAAKFYNRFGMTEIQRTESQIYFQYSSEQFQVGKQDFMPIIQQGDLDG